MDSVPDLLAGEQQVEGNMVICAHRVAMGKEQQENKRAIRSTQHKLAEQSAVSIPLSVSFTLAWYSLSLGIQILVKWPSVLVRGLKYIVM